MKRFLGTVRSVAEYSGLTGAAEEEEEAAVTAAGVDDFKSCKSSFVGVRS